MLRDGRPSSCDGLLLDGHSLQVEQSSITGECEYVEVNKNQNPFLFSAPRWLMGMVV
ncbi:hypothetical protein Pint_07602 [Pistacia integerrima]|uniref:Uncharacterized protein n=1 Tax=Pistacia integerrima TaxID=434235 RepID=A0ACC0XXQ7_9ROSI|nr:hypothetical protein Pint_07602 [Pistacia integerrima]